jgi:hypothetical protein
LEGYGAGEVSAAVGCSESKVYRILPCVRQLNLAAANEFGYYVFDSSGNLLHTFSDPNGTADDHFFIRSLSS